LSRSSTPAACAHTGYSSAAAGQPRRYAGSLATMTAARLPFVAIAIVCAVLGVHLALTSADEARLDRASGALLAGRGDKALTELDGLEGAVGQRAERLRAYAYLDTGQLTRSRAAFQTAVRRDPNNWVLQRDYAVVLLRTGERARARARISKAKALNPRIQLPVGFQDVK